MEEAKISEEQESPGQSPTKDRMGSGDGSDDSFYKAKLLEAKLARKKAEEDAKLLENRLALLQVEEKKALKKIEETKKKAKEIMDLKNRNAEMQRQKELLRKQKEQEELERLQRNREFKEKIKQNSEFNKQLNDMKKANEVGVMKETKKNNKEFYNLQKDETYIKSAQLAMSIKNKEKELQMRKQKDLEERKAAAKKEYDDKIKNELVQKEKIEDMIARLEKQEMEMIQRLQNTQNVQKKAFDDLEKALNVNAPVKQ